MHPNDCNAKLIRSITQISLVAMPTSSTVLVDGYSWHWTTLASWHRKWMVDLTPSVCSGSGSTLSSWHRKWMVDLTTTVCSSDYHRTEDVQLQWLDDTPVELPSDSLSMPQFQLLNITSGECNESYKTGIRCNKVATQTYKLPMECGQGSNCVMESPTICYLYITHPYQEVVNYVFET